MEVSISSIEDSPPFTGCRHNFESRPTICNGEHFKRKFDFFSPFLTPTWYNMIWFPLCLLHPRVRLQNEINPHLKKSLWETYFPILLSYGGCKFDIANYCVAVCIHFPTPCAENSVFVEMHLGMWVIFLKELGWVKEKLEIRWKGTTGATKVIVIKLQLQKI